MVGSRVILILRLVAPATIFFENRDRLRLAKRDLVDRLTSAERDTTPRPAVLAFAGIDTRKPIVETERAILRAIADSRMACPGIAMARDEDRPTGPSSTRALIDDREREAARPVAERSIRNEIDACARIELREVASTGIGPSPNSSSPNPVDPKMPIYLSKEMMKALVENCGVTPAFRGCSITREISPHPSAVMSIAEPPGAVASLKVMPLILRT